MAGISREADKERCGRRFTYYSGNGDAGDHRLKEPYFHVTGAGVWGKTTIGRSGTTDDPFSTLNKKAEALHSYGQKSNKNRPRRWGFCMQLSGFWRIHARIPRGTVAAE